MGNAKRRESLYVHFDSFTNALLIYVSLRRLRRRNDTYSEFFAHKPDLQMLQKC